MTKLAICIPTYNRLPFLKRLVEKIREQSDAVQIVISDNASTDGTDFYLRRLVERDPNVLRIRQPENRGFDVNLLTVVRCATAEWVWIMGDDDYPAPGAVSRVLYELNYGSPDILLVSRFLDTARRTQPFLNAPRGSWFEFKIPGEVERYARAAHFMGSFFSFISSLVVRRSAWIKQPDRPELVGLGYIHVSRAMDMVRDGARLRYVDDPLVICREHDECLTTAGPVKRWKLDAGFLRIIDTVFRDHPGARAAFRQRVRWWLVLLAADLTLRPIRDFIPRRIAMLRRTIALLNTMPNVKGGLISAVIVGGMVFAAATAGGLVSRAIAERALPTQKIQCVCQP